MCCLISQYSTYTLLQNDNFIWITFVGRLLPGGWQYSHVNGSNTVTAKEDVKQSFLLQCNLNANLLVFLKLKFLRNLNSLQSFEEQVMTCSSCNYTVRERKKTGYSWTWIYFNIYLCMVYFIWFMTSYTMRRTCVPCKIRRSPKLRGVRRSPEFFARAFVYQKPKSLHPRVLAAREN